MAFCSGLLYGVTLGLTGTEPLVCLGAGAVVAALVWFFSEKDSHEVPQKAC